MASGKNIEELIDKIVDGWNSRFGDLQKRKESGEAVSEDDVRKVVMDTGQEIFESGVTMSAAEASGHKTDEIKEVFQKVTENKMAASSVVDGLDDDVQVNAIQVAALKGSSGEQRDSLVSSIKSDPDFAPTNGGSDAESESSDDSNAAMAGGGAENENETETEDEPGHQIGGGANSGSGKSDDPNSVMAGEAENETETEDEANNRQGSETGGQDDSNLAMAGGEIEIEHDKNENETEAEHAAGNGQDDNPLAGMVTGGVDDGKVDVMDHAKNVAKDMVGDNGAEHTGLDSLPATVATDIPPAEDISVVARPRRVGGAPMPATTTVAELAAPAVPSMILTDKDGVSRDVISSSPADQAAIQKHISGGGTFAQVDQIAAIYASGDPVAIANWERFAAAGGGTITPITSAGVAVHPHPSSSSTMDTTGLAAANQGMGQSVASPSTTFSDGAHNAPAMNAPVKPPSFDPMNARGGGLVGADITQDELLNALIVQPPPTHTQN